MATTARCKLSSSDSCAAVGGARGGPGLVVASSARVPAPNWLAPSVRPGAEDGARAVLPMLMDAEATGSKACGPPAALAGGSVIPPVGGPLEAEGGGAFGGGGMVCALAAAAWKVPLAAVGGGTFGGGGMAFVLAADDWKVPLAPSGKGGVSRALAAAGGGAFGGGGTLGGTCAVAAVAAGGA